MNYPLTFSQILDHAHRFHGDKHIHTLLPNSRIQSYNYHTFYRRTIQLAEAFNRIGIQQGDRIATLSGNTYQHLEICCAAPYMGAIVHPLNVRLSSKQLTKIVKQAEDKLIFVDGALFEQFYHLLSKIDCDDIVIINLDSVPNSDSRKNINEYEDLISKSEGSYKSLIQDENLGMALCYTSGTDGEPKGVLYTHRSMFLHTLAVNQQNVFGLTEQDVVMPLVPMFHAMSWGIPFASMSVGADIVLSNAKHDGLVNLIRDVGVTVAAGVPTIWRKLLPELLTRKQDISSLQRIIVGGEAASPELIRCFETELGIEVRHAWGMTELSPTGTFSSLLSKHHHITDNEKFDIKAKQGRPIQGVQLRIVDEKDVELPWDGNAVGELLVKSPWLVSSYYNYPPSPEHFTTDGWLRTGDLATIDSEGYMQIVDRVKALIRSGGESISAGALESIIQTHHYVDEAVVVGISDEKWGERPVAVVVLSDHADGNYSETLRNLLLMEFPKFWIPDKFIVVDEIPKTGVGKTDKQAILQMLS